MSSTAFIEPLPVIDFVTQLLNRDVTSRPLSDSDRIKVRVCCFGLFYVVFTWSILLLKLYVMRSFGHCFNFVLTDQKGFARSQS